jgi:hypothetical protein
MLSDLAFVLSLFCAYFISPGFFIAQFVSLHLDTYPQVDQAHVVLRGTVHRLRRLVGLRPQARPLRLAPLLLSLLRLLPVICPQRQPQT